MPTKKVLNKPANKLTPKDYVHLHNHTQYSLLDGLTKIPPLIDKVKEMGMESIAITDHGTMSGVVEFYKTAKATGVKSIIGMETYVARRGHNDRNPAKDKNPYHLTILAMNNQGYKNLMKLSTIANLDGFYYRPRVDRKLLKKYNDGLIILSGCIGGEVGEALREGLNQQAKDIVKWYKSVFGERYYLEVQDHGHKDHPTAWAEQIEVNTKILKISKELSVQAVVTCDAHYLTHEDQDAHEVLLCVQTGSYLSDENRMSLKNLEIHLTDPKSVIKRWGKDYPKLITNTKKIADLCNVELELGKILIPRFPLPKGETEKLHLEKLVYQGLAWRYSGLSREKALKLSIADAKKTLKKQILNRAAYELQVIEDMKFSGFFLIVADFINWGKDSDIVFGPGRGSASGSICSYALRITELDPLEHNLLFERFLNPERISMPDFDIDIQDSRRDEVIEYCIDKYGNDRVANIVTFGRMAARNAVRDVARVLQVPYADADRLAKMIPPPVQGRHIPLSDSLKTNSDLKAEYKDSEQARTVFDLAVQLEGTIRSHGVHAAGVVIAPDNIVDYVPLEMAQKGVVATQYPMGPIEDLGLLKIDFLGLSNLTIIKNTLRIVRKVYGESIDIAQIPMDNKETFELLTRGDTTGVFQLESAGMKRYLKELRPTIFDDIIAMVALYRPGPMQWIDDFIARKHGRKNIEYLYNEMEPSLSSTYGVIVYQEQVMQISKDMCSFSGGQADSLRKAIGKKKPEELAKLKNDFIEGAIKTINAKRSDMEKFWSQLEAFAAYCFPKSHAACYGLIAYQTAYLKAHYPDAFMAALMTSDFDNTDRLSIEISECKHMGIEVLPPDVNESFVEFAVVPEAQQIRFGLAAIKNVGTAAVEEILRAREVVGGFSNLEDFFTKVNTAIVNRKAIESLIKSGAFDSLDDRHKLLGNIDVLMAYGSAIQKLKRSGQTDLFGESVGNLSPQKIRLSENNEPAIPAEQMQWERELLGVYLSQHPLESYADVLTKTTTPLNSLKSHHDGKSMTVGGLITDIREITTKNGQKMAFVRLADTNGEVELILFPRYYQNDQAFWQTDKVIRARGKVTSKDRSGSETGEVKILVDSVEELLPPSEPEDEKLANSQPVPENTAKQRVYIRLPNSENQDTLLSLKQTIDLYEGDTEVVLVVGNNGEPQIIKLPIKMHSADKALGALKELVGNENVVVK